MAIGSEIISYGRDPVRRRIGMWCGTSDLHSHIRIRPLVKILPPLLPLGPINLIELGCSNGLNLFELAKVKRDIIAEGYDLDHPAIEHGEKVRKEYFHDSSITLHCADVTQIAATRNSYDCVLLMDVLEHITDDTAISDWVVAAAKEGGLVCISVPTHRYSRVFGKNFTNSSGTSVRVTPLQS